MRAGFKSVYWPGRLELVGRHPHVYLDGAHNPAAAHVLVEEVLAAVGKGNLVAGVMADKDVGGLTRSLARAARRVWTVAPPDARALPAEDLAVWFRDAGVPAEPRQSLNIALAEACRDAGRKGTVLVAGSLYNIAPARRA